MGRWTQYDEDEYRLPEGMKRVGYDMDSGRYTYRDSGGKYYMGGEGARYGEMVQAQARGGEDLEASPRARNGEDHTRPMIPPKQIHISRSSYRTLFPFFLIIAVCLLLIWRLILSPSLYALNHPSSSSGGLANMNYKKCPEGTVSRWVQPGDTCWELARKEGWTVERFREVNGFTTGASANGKGGECERLMPGMSVCLPEGGKVRRRRL
ncbi:hypothetical protein CVT26_013949 [Gymnopilus dilepis]|uniref:LysM domain-containing protein n=1 Tax=Gymnopilus dilepis TaxID=231916 RepID=A0A409WZZ0_9AGAR|nr:hypothetical protein CVT26_013949 [Gymnopilus dilepis]